MVKFEEICSAKLLEKNTPRSVTVYTVFRFSTYPNALQSEEEVEGLYNF